jgi:GT2 family glycosyltransferase
VSAQAAFIMAHGRQELLDECIAAIRPQVDRILVLDNASKPELEVAEDVTLLRLPDQPPNLARWWNVGLNFYATIYRDEPYQLAVLCDDTVVPEGWFNAISAAMHYENSIAGSSSPWGHPFPPIVKRHPDDQIATRMCSWAFVVDGRSLTRADESMLWWWFDTDFDFRLRQEGGTVLIGTHPVPNVQMNHYTNTKPELGEQAGRDRGAFMAKWGGVPW